MTEKLFDRTNSIYIMNIPQKGRGVFANIPFKRGDLLERAPTFGLDRATAKILDSTALLAYYFGRHDMPLASESLAGYVVFGFASIVNHSWNPNAKIVWDDEETGAWVSVVAIRDIKVGEEITHRYTDISAFPDTFID
ncbi:MULTISPECIES: SET domain-containing protein-lysine N-methyltransferase [unclassified Mesorhizobium]|uniref:SET domain-containing protein-lysine N-methyltransferase n=1 Tax=unclassified Mesorhizobium TaxID=325217 RepID=UPI00109243A5|nr:MULTISPECIES: SET domain-containing protein-lysine N-methyltransferase [unclassified Mesorhizobium]TGQ37798.1 SET domain-containing protein-lysine N-methyltransferase [Mesorhizobium sp. M4B.F.Ca.ET.214.01.1.1]TGQ59565.1 SET domain-containing protein-lysine N-methyltransferase [Mesorhizobium sp. M4B.F.Ca.ET.211.01.1.1]TGU34631.1 SET domain-containing protein-lysine N-methyltransferase [Mesorhizobium sp. M4B.F.Ca.ET.150.01.1.1]